MTQLLLGGPIEIENAFLADVVRLDGEEGNPEAAA
jgi:hypothetical protein